MGRRIYRWSVPSIIIPGAYVIQTLIVILSNEINLELSCLCLLLKGLNVDPICFDIKLSKFIRKNLSKYTNKMI